MLQRLYEDYLMAKLQQRAGSRAAADGAGAGETFDFVERENAVPAATNQPRIPFWLFLLKVSSRSIAAFAVMRGLC